MVVKTELMKWNSSQKGESGKRSTQTIRWAQKKSRSSNSRDTHCYLARTRLTGGTRNHSTDGTARGSNWLFRVAGRYAHIGRSSGWWRFSTTVSRIKFKRLNKQRDKSIGISSREAKTEIKVGPRTVHRSNRVTGHPFLRTADWLGGGRSPWLWRRRCRVTIWHWQ